MKHILLNINLFYMKDKKQITDYCFTKFIKSRHQNYAEYAEYPTLRSRFTQIWIR